MKKSTETRFTCLSLDHEKERKKREHKTNNMPHGVTDTHDLSFGLIFTKQRAGILY